MSQLLWFVSGIFIYNVLSMGFSWMKSVQADLPHDYFKFGVTGHGKRRYPIVFHDNYDISFWGFEKYHPFDTHKWLKTHQLITDHFKENFSSTFPLKEADENVLSTHHTLDYIKEIHKSNTMIANVAEIPLLYWVPNYLLRSKLLEPFKWQASGTILASRQAMLHGTAINLGGGMHHACSTRSSGFCFFADIGLAIRYLWDKVDKNLKFLIIDLDAHQGNGHEMDKYLLLPGERDRILTLDAYNKDIFPQDLIAKSQINYKIEMESGTSSDEYLDRIMKAVEENSKEIIQFKPDLVIYNAGTDILEGDPLGLLKVSEQGILRRDEFIFKFCHDNDLPIVLLMSGGYQKNNAEIVANSIINLIEQGLIKPIDNNESEVTSQPPTEEENGREDIKIGSKY